MSSQQLITDFYNAFQKKDYRTMQNCYANNAVFNDEVFSNLNANEVRGMWEMFCKRGQDLQISFSNVKANEKEGSAEWIGTYTFSKTNRNVINHIRANFTFRDGKIITHIDKFNFYNWARQAFGLTGILLGWTPFFRNKVRKEAKNNLGKFMSRSQ